MEFLLVLQVLQSAKFVSLVSHALRALRLTILCALQALTALEIVALLLVMQESIAQQERNSFRTTMPSALLECTAQLVLHLFAALLVPTHP